MVGTQEEPEEQTDAKFNGIAQSHQPRHTRPFPSRNSLRSPSTFMESAPLNYMALAPIPFARLISVPGLDLEKGDFRSILSSWPCKFTSWNVEWNRDKLNHSNERIFQDEINFVNIRASPAWFPNNLGFAIIKKQQQWICEQMLVFPHKGKKEKQSNFNV